MPITKDKEEIKKIAKEMYGETGSQLIEILIDNGVCFKAKQKKNKFVLKIENVK